MRTPRGASRFVRLAVALAVAVAVTLVVAVAGLAPPARAERPDRALAAELRAAGWRQAEVLHQDEALVVVAARKGRARGLVAVRRASADQPAQVVALGEISATGRAQLEVSVRPFLKTDLLDVELEWTVRGPQGAERSESRHHLLRVAPALQQVCELDGSLSVDPGRRCGSGARDSVTLRPAEPAADAAPGTVAFVLRKERWGDYSERRGGACMHRSPVRNTPEILLYEVPPRGPCTSEPAKDRKPELDF